jgi:signal transduction histidine kinase
MPAPPVPAAPVGARAAPAAPAAAARLLPLVRPQVSRRGVGVSLVLGAGIAALWANGAIRPAGEAVLTAVIVLVAGALIFAPSWRRLVRTLSAEQAERVRSQERADVGAHLHDSVLQTLALIQRGADDPQRVATLARTQERELRAWLAGEEVRQDGASLAAALKAAASEVEGAVGGAIEVVAVGDCQLDEPAAATLAAAKEAMLNAAKFAPGAPVSVFAELSAQRLEIFVRDRGPGFDLASVPAERRGVRESIVGRMRRVGGHATVRSAAGEGTEVELAIERAGGPA